MKYSKKPVAAVLQSGMEEIILKYLFKFLSPYKKLLVAGPVFKLLEAILELMLPLLMAKIIDNGVAAGDRSYILKVGGIMLLTALVGTGCALICQYSASLVSQGVGTDIRNAMFEHIGTLSDSELDRTGSSSLVNRITNDVNQVQTAVAMLIRLVIRAPFLCIGGLIMAFVIDPRMAVIMVIVLPVFILVLFLTMTKTVPLYKTVQRKLDGISLALREYLAGVRVIRAFSRMDFERKRFSVQNGAYRENAVRVGRISALLNPVTTFIMNTSVIAILWYGGLRVNTGTISTGDIMALIGYVTQILASLIVISNLVVIFTKAFASAARVSEVLKMEPGIKNLDSVKRHGPIHSEYSVEFKHVCMSYGKGGDNDLEDISVRIKRGQTIGIIGGTGSGKSTLVNLIPRFLDVSDGQVFVDGQDVRNYPLAELRRKIGIVFQKPVLFTGTIEDNIRWGNPDAGDAEIRQAAELAQAVEFIDKLPEGFKTRIQRGGSNVSGGQKQRLTIARALIRQPEILILDDSFSALDYVTDAKLRKAIRQCSENMTTIIVSQRAGTIRSVDQILVLNEGRLTGCGTHESLMENCDIYREICESQMQNGEAG